MDVFVALAGVEARLGERIDAFDARLRECEDATREAKDAATESRRTNQRLDELIPAVLALVRRDENHEARIKAIEDEAIAKGVAAGAASGKRWAVVGTVLGTGIASAVQWLMTH